MFLKNKKSSLVAVIIIILSLGLAVQPTMSVNANSTNSTTVGMSMRFYRVRPGDNLWDLSKRFYGDPTKWKKLAADNGLSDSVFMGPRGMYNQPQQYCALPTSLVLMYYSSEGNIQPTEPEIIPIGIPDKATVDTAGASPGTTTKDSQEIPTWWSNWWWLYLLLFTFLMILIGKRSNRRKELKKDPVTSGEPQVVGGVTDENAVQRMHNVALANGFDPLDVSNITRGRLFGAGRVMYADKPSGALRSFNGQVGYMGIVKRKNGSNQVIYFLQGCGNDARQGDFFTEINFVADEQQPQTLTAYNAERARADNESRQNESNSEEKNSPVDPVDKFFATTDKVVEKGMNAFFMMTLDGKEFRFDSLDKRSETGSRTQSSSKTEKGKTLPK